MATNRTEASAGMTPQTRLSARRTQTKTAAGADLTARERDVPRQLAAGLGTVAISAPLLVLPAAVNNHTRSVMTELGAHSRVETIAVTLSPNVPGPP